MARSFTTKIRVCSWGNITARVEEELEVLIDSGSAHTSLPCSTLNRLKIPVRGKITLRLANGQLIKREYGPCEIFVVNR